MRTCFKLRYQMIYGKFAYDGHPRIIKAADNLVYAKVHTGQFSHTLLESSLRTFLKLPYKLVYGKFARGCHPPKIKSADYLFCRKVHSGHFSDTLHEWSLRTCFKLRYKLVYGKFTHGGHPGHMKPPFIYFTDTFIPVSVTSHFRNLCFGVSSFCTKKCFTDI